MTTLIAIPDTSAWVRDVFAIMPDVKDAEVDPFNPGRVLLTMNDGSGKVLDIQETGGRSFINVPAPADAIGYESEIRKLEDRLADAEDDLRTAEEDEKEYDEEDLAAAKEEVAKEVLALCEKARRARRPLPTLEEVLEALDA
jgi:hypothetical protein